MDKIEYAHEIFQKWLGTDYDLDVLDVVLAVAAGDQLDGDPAWLQVVGGPGSGKTETVVTLEAAGAHVTSSISSEGALLSATSKKEKSVDATGGLLRKIGSSGILVLKDFTTVLAQNRDTRATVLAALREVYDGSWSRNVGTDGGMTLSWAGRIVLISAVTTAWDQAHAVIAEMGDRFILVRMDSTKGRARASHRAIRNTGDEIAMRSELAGAVKTALVVDRAAELDVSEAEGNFLVALADLVTLARTAVIRDYAGNVVDAHAPEMPTRFVKQLTQVIRGSLALGMSRDRAVALARRCAADSMPPLRLACLLDIAEHPESLVSDVRKRVDKPRSTIDRELQALHMLGLLTLTEIGIGNRTEWRYSIADADHADALALLISGIREPSPDLLQPTYGIEPTPALRKVGNFGNGSNPVAFRESDITPAYKPTEPTEPVKPTGAVGQKPSGATCPKHGTPTHQGMCGRCAAEAVTV